MDAGNHGLAAAPHAAVQLTHQRHHHVVRVPVVVVARDHTIARAAFVAQVVDALPRALVLQGHLQSDLKVFRVQHADGVAELADRACAEEVAELPRHHGLDVRDVAQRRVIVQAARNRSIQLATEQGHCSVV